MLPLTRETENKAANVRMHQDHIDSLRLYGKVNTAELEQMQADLDEYKNS